MASNYFENDTSISIPEERPSKRGVPLLLLVGGASLVIFIGVSLSLYFIADYYGDKAVDDLQMKLRRTLPTGLKSTLIAKLDLLPHHQETTMNYIKLAKLNIRQWDDMLKLRDIQLAYLVTFPPESRCCSGFMLKPLDPSYQTIQPYYANRIDMWSNVVLRPDGIMWWFNTSVQNQLYVNYWDTDTREFTSRVEMQMTDFDISPWYTYGDPYLPENRGPTYTPTAVWMFDEVQLKIHTTIPLFDENDEWYGTYVSGFKLGFLSNFLSEQVADLVGWEIMLIDAHTANYGIILASSVPKTPLLSCYADERCAKEEFSPCVPCGNSSITTLQAVQHPNSYLREAASGVLKESGNNFTRLLTRDIDFDMKVNGKDRLVSTFHITFRKLEWVGVIIIDRSEIFGTVEEGQQINLIIAVCMIVLGGVFFIILSIAISTPLRRLANHLVSVSEMDLNSDFRGSAIANVVSEFSICETTFMKMVSQLREYRSYLPEAALFKAAAKKTQVKPPSGLVVIGFTDILNSTLLWENISQSVMAETLELHNSAMRKCLATYNGYEVKTIGDAFMVAFSSVENALQWAAAVQKELMTINWPAEILQDSNAVPVIKDGTMLYNGPRVRMGFHVGNEPTDMGHEESPFSDRVDYMGPAVNKAARVSGLALPGMISVSESLKQKIENMKLPLTPIESMGKKDLKGIGQVEVFFCYPDGLAGRDALLKKTDGSTFNRPSRSPSVCSSLSIGVPRFSELREGYFKLRKKMGTIALAESDYETGGKPKNLLFLQAILDTLPMCEGVVESVLGTRIVASWNLSSNSTFHCNQAVRFAGIALHKTGDLTSRVGIASGQLLHGSIGGSSKKYHSIQGSMMELPKALLKMIPDSVQTCALLLLRGGT
eukprot:TRINITY_DN1306_c0_g1_i1.p1 TRINITY_DN1306_c0_g1~~TRINITY_DN1306_c0_g1_i1.p1  ORF type:complete len:884 (+),score=169.21 TRINITY_DN1306_c0_g1_i1:110-2761(+)